MRATDVPSQDQSVTQETLNALQDLIIGTKEDLEDQLDQMKQAISAADTSTREVLQNDIDRLQSSLDSITQAQRIADNTHPRLTIKRNRAGQGSRAIFGTDTSQPQFDLTVSENEAELGAVMSAGVHSPETLQALLGTSRTPELALVLQALQTQPRSTQDQFIQSIVHTLS